jgi:hypothetical protein
MNKIGKGGERGGEQKGVIRDWETHLQFLDSVHAPDQKT